MADHDAIETAARCLRAKQHEYYLQWVKDAIEIETQRKAKLERAGTKEECRRLEKQFEKERAKDRERVRQIQEDHELILKAKIAEWKAHGVPDSALTTRQPSKQSDTTVSFGSTPEKKVKPKVGRMSKAAIERLSTPAAVTPVSQDITQEFAFHKDAIRRQDKLRLSRYQANADNLKTLSETDLLQRKMSLLNQLHEVVSHQERIILDDQWTVRSSVSSWKSADLKSVKDSGI